jgi:hypothetical protein
MEEVMKAINAPVTKPLAFLTFADMYKSDPSPYIIEGLTNLAVKHAEYIPGVSTQLIALTMKEAEMKTQILAYMIARRASPRHSGWIVICRWLF